MRKIIFLFVIALMSACVSKTEYEKAIIKIDSLQIENARLAELNDELENGEERLIKLINKCYANKDFINANQNLEKNILAGKIPTRMFLIIFLDSTQTTYSKASLP